MSIFRSAIVGRNYAAWNVYYASYRGVSFSLSSQDTSPFGLFFKPDGTKMYVVGGIGNDVNEYSLSTPWDISTTSYSQNFSVSAQDVQPTGLFFKPDGTKMYVVGYDGVDVNEYTLSSAWDISTASYSQNFTLAVFTNWEFLGLFFKPDGTKMYAVEAFNQSVREYDLSSAWDIGSASFNQAKSFGGGREGQGLFFKSDGTKMFVSGDSTTYGESVFEYNLSVPWDVSTASYSQNLNVSSQDSDPKGLFFRDDGRYMYFVGNSTDTVYQYNL